MQLCSVQPRSEHSAQAEMLDMQEVTGSSPVSPTNPFPEQTQGMSGSRVAGASARRFDTAHGAVVGLGRSVAGARRLPPEGCRLTLSCPQFMLIALAMVQGRDRRVTFE